MEVNKILLVFRFFGTAVRSFRATALRLRLIVTVAEQCVALHEYGE